MKKDTAPSSSLSIRLGSGKPEIRISKSGLRPWRVQTMLRPIIPDFI